MTPEQIQGWLQLGLGGLMLAAMFLGFRGVWVWGSTLRAAEAMWERFYAEVVADRDRWRDIALRGISTAEKAATVAEGSIKNGR